MGCRLFWRYLLRWCQCHVRRRMVSTHHRLSESGLRSGESPRVRSSLKGIGHEFPMVSERDLEGGSAGKRRPLIGVRFGTTLVLDQYSAGNILEEGNTQKESSNLRKGAIIEARTLIWPEWSDAVDEFRPKRPLVCRASSHRLLVRIGSLQSEDPGTREWS